VSETATPRRTLSLAVLALCEVFGMALWFSAAAVLPALKAQYDIVGFQAAALSSSVALGFVCGTFASALLGLADRIEPRRFFACASLVGAAANALTVLVAPTGLSCILLRALVGASIAGIYPVGIKMAATWARADLGLLVGLLVAAATLGSATSFLLAAFGGLDWRYALIGASALAVIGAALIQVFSYGPGHARASAFRARYVLDAWRVKPLRLANFGYYGHMWELYAMWAWIAAYIEASFQAVAPLPDAPFWAKIAAFAAIGLGAIGCLAGGVLADRFGRTTLTIAAMAVSGSCTVLAGFLFGSAPWLLVTFCIVWGIAVIADSAQFSASVVELSDPDRVGTMVTVQTCIGFLLTMVSIHLLPPINAALGWRWTFLYLAIGPLLGAWAMLALRHDPAAAKLASGKG
jgi:MFS family permease